MAQNNNGQNNEYFKERAGTGEARYHVVPHQEEEWAVKREGQDNPESTFKSKSDAVEEGKKLAKNSQTMVYIHDGDGQIESQENYEQ